MFDFLKRMGAKLVGLVKGVNVAEVVKDAVIVEEAAQKVKKDLGK